MTSQTLIIGGGAAGFFAAIRRAECFPTEQITILERGKSVLEKVRISGGGRCNVTHGCWEPKELVKYYPRGGRELLGPFHQFACGDTMGWFSDRGVELKIEEDGRVFPVSDSSQSIIDVLWETAKRRGVRVMTKARVTQILAPSPDLASRNPPGLSPATAPENKPSGRWTIRTDAEVFYADRLVVTTGSNPAVWQMLEDLGHRVVPPVPSLFAFDTKDTRLRDLSGVSLPWAQVGIAGQALRAEGPLLITHRGLSGPAILRLSAWGARELAPLNHQFALDVNWLARRPSDVETQLDAWRLEEAKRQINARAYFELPLRLWKSLVAAAGIPEEQQWAQLNKGQRTALTEQLTAAQFRITGKSMNKDEFTTAGGVDLREIDFKSFRSKIHPTLFLAGEVLDIDAITGGFNFQAAWTGGWLIGGGG
ncbi:NAD(P)/FAD-dependent oxidoreductase [Neolewinella lacunae]|uniref:NAD(P)/FAD-dependent oxidoreductase n=1 Tax=Neolewinella lacunae TaxID=1517758 RepID=A0A923PKV6_9BACT|nr:NAD(P)/FAD-dependent oxidoreductase [Neolewinella lacunae]MBC6994566.1 NAD(P)/FAD-dependent oxidoreductase [Neolewinella lacunae]MDN3633915.1 NAD(P)/FAD-dependent oxidoreductase [Neolewinella lacunae]